MGDVVGYKADGRRGRKWLAKGLTKAAVVGREADNFTAIATWADAGGGHGPRGGRHQCRWATWPPVVGLRADAGGGPVLRGGGFTSIDDVATWADASDTRVLRGGLLYCCWGSGRLWLARGLTQAAGASREVSGFDATG